MFKHTSILSVKYVWINLWGPSNLLPNPFDTRPHTDTGNICVAQIVVNSWGLLWPEVSQELQRPQLLPANRRFADSNPGIPITHSGQISVSFGTSLESWGPGGFHDHSRDLFYLFLLMDLLFSEFRFPFISSFWVDAYILVVISYYNSLLFITTLQIYFIF